MIRNFRKVTDHLYRGGNLHPKDVLYLKEMLNINKIISLDADVAKRIDRTTKLLNIEHIIIPIGNTKSSVLKLFSYSLKELLGTGNVFVGCVWGKDRTGLVIAIYKIKYMGMNPHKALEEAKSLGFGINVPLDWIKLYEKLILNAKPSKDLNNASIVDNTREGTGDSRDSYLHHSDPSSNAAFLDKTKQYPTDLVYNPINDQSPTRENYNLNKSIKEHNLEHDIIPQIGVYNNDAGIHGAGPTENAGGFIYD